MRSRWQRWVLILAGVMLAATSAAVIPWRREADADPTRCLGVTVADRRMLLDLRTGMRLEDRRRPEDRFAQYERVSPDGNLSVAALFSASGNGQTSWVALRHVGSETRTVIQEEVGSGVDFWWTPDSRWVLLLWLDQKRTTRLSLVAADASHRYEVALPDQYVQSQPVISPDGLYVMLVMGSQVGTSVEVFALPTLHRTSYPVPRSGPIGIQWSPQGHWLAWVEGDANMQASVWVRLVSPEYSGERVALPVSAFNAPLLLNSSNNIGPWMQWAEDGPRFLVHYFDPTWRLVSVDTQGQVKLEHTLTEVDTLHLGHQREAQVLFADDGRTFTYLRSTGAVQDRAGVALPLADLIVVDRRDQQARVVLQRVVESEYDVARNLPLRGYDAAGQRLVLPTWRDGVFDLHLINLDGSGLITLIRGAATLNMGGFGSATNAYDPAPFLSGRDWLAVFWTPAEEPPPREPPALRLTWARSDGRDLRTVSFQGRTIDLLRFNRGGQHLVIESSEAQTSPGSQVTMIDLHTGELTPVIEAVEGGWLPLSVVELAATPNTLLAPELLWVTTWQRAASAQPGTAAFTVSVAHPVTGPILAVAVDEVPTRGVAYLAPDRSRAFVLLSNDRRDVLLLAQAGQAVPLWERDLSQSNLMGYVAWSPDGTQAAMIMRTANSDQHWIEVIDAQGRLIRTTAFRGGVVNDLRWEGCD